MKTNLTGLIAATHTPFRADGLLNLDVVEKQAAHLLRDGVSLVFIGGSTGESHSLTLDERRRLAERWFAVAKGTPMRVIVHVGSNCLDDARTLASHAQALGATAIAALTPSYFKPTNVDSLVACCSRIAEAAERTPFYFYDIPVLTHVSLPMPEFLEAASDRIPNLAGLKFTNNDLVSLQTCLRIADGKFDILFGMDEILLAALSFGVRGAVGSTYNFAAPLYHRLIAAFDRGDFAAARREQLRSVELVGILAKRGFMASAKAMMGFLGVPVGPARLPHENLSPGRIDELRRELESHGPW